jgi:hypothetical protein
MSHHASMFYAKLAVVLGALAWLVVELVRSGRAP